MKKKLLAWFIGVCMVCTCVGCGSGGNTAAAGNTAGSGQTEASQAESSSGEKKKVTFYMWASDAEQEFDKAIVAQYEKENPDIDIEENYIPYAEYLSKINTMAAAGSMPDIFNLPEGNVFEWGAKGALLDLKPLYEAAGVNPSDVSVDSAIFSTDENVWSVGYNVTTLCLYYNKELLEENGIAFPGIDASQPWSWDEFVENAKKITKDSSGSGPDDAAFDPDNITVYGTMMPTDWVKSIPLLHTNDSGILNEDGTALGISSDAGIEVIQSIADLGNKIHCAPSNAMAKGAFSDASAMLMNGQVAMVIDGGWALANYTNEGFDVGVAPIPAFKHPADISWTAGLCMSPNAADNKEAFDFYQYFTNFTNSIQAALDQGVSLGGLPHTLEVFDGGENEAKWVSTYTKVDATQMCEAFKNILQADTTVLGDNVRVKNFPVIVDNTIVPALDNVWLGEVSAKEALEALDLSDSIDGYWK